MKGKDPIFRGAATALVTPFTETGVDYESFGRLIDWQIEKGIDALAKVDALRRGSGKCCHCGSVAKTNSNCQ